MAQSNDHECGDAVENFQELLQQFDDSESETKESEKSETTEE
jgi:hypothetical protein